jgi:hypothetical protein
MKQSLIFSLKVLLTSAAFAPLILMLLKFFTDKEKFDPDYSMILIGYLKMVVVYLLMLTVPCLILLFSYKPILRKSIMPGLKKLIFVLEFELVIGVWSLLGFSVNLNPTLSDLLFWLSLSLPSACCIWLYRLKPVDTPLQNRL